MSSIQKAHKNMMNYHVRRVNLYKEITDSLHENIKEAGEKLKLFEYTSKLDSEEFQTIMKSAQTQTDSVSKNVNINLKNGPFNIVKNKIVNKIVQEVLETH